MNTQFLASAASTTDSAIESVSNFWNDEKVQSWLIERPIRIAIILILAIIAHWLLHRVINKVAENSIKSSGLDKQRLRGKFKGRANRPELSQQEEAMRQTRETRRASRIKTLAGVARSAAAIFVWVWAVIAILDELEVNVAPLIASAGVIGVALGFGAQALVKDFLSGIFMLIEDQYGIGDVVIWAMASLATSSPSPCASPRSAISMAPCGTCAMVKFSRWPTTPMSTLLPASRFR